MSFPGLKEIARQPELLTGGHRLCSGCAAPVIGRLIMHALRKPDNTIVVQPTGCFEVSTTIYPYSAWRIPWVHSAFENSAATASGIVAAYKVFSRRRGISEPDVICISGDGATVDIGLQALSGAWERRDRFLYVLYDNGAYMNTGIQRSSATPYAASTTTSPAGRVIPGKREWAKPIARIAAEHDIPYVATASPAYWRDLMMKVRRGLEADGPAFMHALSPCPRGWRHASDLSIHIARLATQTCFFPLWECANREYKLSAPSVIYQKRPDLKKPVEAFLQPQGRFRHLFKPEKRTDIIETIQRSVDREWNLILTRCKGS